MKFKIGDQVEARQEWADLVPSGRVNACDKWEDDGAFRIDGDHRFWAAYVFKNRADTAE